MVDRDKPLDIDDLPSIQAEKRDSVSAQLSKSEQKPAKVKNPTGGKTSSMTLLLIFAVLVLFAGLIFSGYLLKQQQSALASAEARIAALEGRLSTTDESLSQSSVALQVRLQELKERTDELWEQMDKLWASAWRRNQTEIAEQSTKIDSSVKEIKALKLQFSQQEKIASDLKKQAAEQTASVGKINSRMETLTASQKALEQQQKNSSDLQKQLNNLQAKQEKLQSQVEDSKGWIESNNAFRQQTNQSLIRIDQQLKALNNPAP